MPKVRITDVSLRDGSHPIFHQFDREHIVKIAGALDVAGVPVLEVTHVGATDLPDRRFNTVSPKSMNSN